MNRFELKLLDVSDGERECWNGMLFVDDEPVMSHEDYSIEWHQLVSSLIEPGQYQQFTCTCGDADCGGIGRHNIVTHHGSVLRWEMKQEAWRPVLEFDRADAIRHTLEIMEEIRAFVPPAEYGTDYPVLPVIFSDRTLDWCLQTLRTGKIEGSPWDNMITADMIPPAKRDFSYLERKIDRPLPSAKWIRRKLLHVKE